MLKYIACLLPFPYGNQRASFMQLQFFVAYHKFFDRPKSFENSELRKLPHYSLQGEALSLESSLFKGSRTVLLSWKIHYHFHKCSQNFPSYTDEYFHRLQKKGGVVSHLVSSPSYITSLSCFSSQSFN